MWEPTQFSTRRSLARISHDRRTEGARRKWSFRPDARPRYPERFDASGLKEALGFAGVKGKDFVDGSGAPIVFQVVGVADPDLLERNGHWNRNPFAAMVSWGANVVRLPAHPAAYRGRGKEACLALHDQAVVWANEHRLYIIIDWHSIGNLATEMFQHPMYETTRKETYDFWRSVAFRYEGVSTIAFYELLKEPTRRNGTRGDVSWQRWKEMMEELTSILYAHDQRVVPLGAGFNWAYEPKHVATDPIEREGVGYVSHPDPQKTTRPYDARWDETFGCLAAKDLSPRRRLGT